MSINKWRLEHNLTYVVVTGIALVIGVLGCSLLVGSNPEIERWRVLFFWRIIELLTIFTGTIVIVSSKRKGIDVHLFLLLLGVLSVAFLSVLISPHTAQSIWGNYYRADGVITLVHFFLFGVVVALNWGTQLEKLLLKVLPVVTGMVAMYVLIWYGIYHFSQGHAPQWQLLLKGVWQLPNENMIAGFLLVFFPIYVKRVWDMVPHKLFRLVLISMPVLAIVVTQSWGAILTAGITAALFIFHKKIPLSKTLAVVIFLVMAVLLLFVWQQYSGNVVEGRGLLFRSLFVSMSEKPLFGWGWSNVDIAFESGYSKTFGFTPDLYVDKAHSLWLEYSVTTGIVGLVVYIILQIRLFKVLLSNSTGLRRSFSTVLLWSLILFCIHSQTNVISIAEEILFWLIVGFSLAKIPKQA